MITLTTEQAQQIEEALKLAIRTSYSEHNNIKFEASLATIRAARAQEQAEQEPVSLFEWQNGNPVGLRKAAPVRIKDLTDDEIEKAVENIIFDENFDINIARAVIAADREKNRG